MIEVENLYPISKFDGRAPVDEEVQEHEVYIDDEPEVYVEDGWNKPVKSAPLLRLTIKEDRNYGNCTPLLYYRGEPLVVVGPDCRLISPGPFTLGLLIAIVVFFRGGENTLIRPSCPLLTYWIALALELGLVSSLTALALKNPGVKSQPRSTLHGPDTL